MARGRATYWLARNALPQLEKLIGQTIATIPRPPERLTVVRAGGPDPDRILLAGGYSAVGWGTLRHDLALAGHLARLLPPATTRGADVEVLASPTTTATTVRDYLVSSVTSRYDAIVLTLGLREVMEFMPVDVWSLQLGGLLDHISAGNGDPPAVVVVGAEEISPIPVPRWLTRSMAIRARALNLATREVVALRNRVAYVDSAMLPPSSTAQGLGVSDPSALYERAAAAIVPVLVPLLEESHERQVPHPVDDEARRHALDYLRSYAGDLAPVRARLQTVRDVLGVRSADLYMVDENMVRFIATTGTVTTGQVRATTASSMALDHRDGIAIPDLRKDPRFRDRVEVTGEPYLRFYAAHPVESPDGHRVALLSVVDTEPREFTASDLALLRSCTIAISHILFADY